MHVVADGAIGPDDRVVALGAVNDGAVLDGGAGADDDAPGVAPQHGAGPDRRLLVEPHPSDHDRVGVDVRRLVDLRLVVSQGVDRHGVTLGWPPMSAAPPTAKRVPVERVRHGDRVIDEYAWLRDRDDPDTIAYLEAENAWTEDQLAHTRPLQDTIFEEIKSRILETDLSVPTRKQGWWYFSRTEEGKQYPIHC